MEFKLESLIHQESGSFYIKAYNADGRFGPFASEDEVYGKLEDYRQYLVAQGVDLPTPVVKPAPPVETQLSPLEQVVARYLEIRDEKSALTKRHAEEMKRLDDQLEKGEAWLLDQLNQAGCKSMNTHAGTIISQEQFRPTIADKGAFFTFLRSNTDHLELLQSRVSSTTLKAFKDATGELPPGVTASVERVVSVRRK